MAKLSEDLWHANGKPTKDKVPLMEHMISGVETYLQTILKSKDQDPQILTIIGVKSDTAPRISRPTVIEKP